MSRREMKPHYSKPSSNQNELLELLYQENSRPFYECVLKHVPEDEFTNVKEFAAQVLPELQSIPSANPFDCIADIVKILGGLSEAGLIQTRSIELREGHCDRVCGARIEYKRLHKSFGELMKGVAHA